VAGTVLVLGGRSEIGLAVARRLASGVPVVLAARRADDLDEPERRLRNAGATAVHRVEFDADDVAGQRAVLDHVAARFGPLDVVSSLRLPIVGSVLAVTGFQIVTVSFTLSLTQIGEH